MEREINKIKLELRQGDITRQEDCMAIVNAANAQLRNGGGVAGAIHAAAGRELEKEAVKMAPISPGEAVITRAYNLPNRYVIHCLGPIYGKDRPEDELLANCYKNALELAEENNISSIAFPAISTGIFGYPVDKAAKVALNTIIKKLPDLKWIKKVVLVLHSSEDLTIHHKILEDICDKR